LVEKSVVSSSDSTFPSKNISEFVVNFVFLLTDIGELTKVGEGKSIFLKKVMAGIQVV